jgi:hypothetical protein
MAPGRVRRLSPDEIRALRNAVIGVRSLPDYQPRNHDYNADALEELVAAMDHNHAVEVRVLQEAAITRTSSQASEWALYDRLLGVKDELRAQYGPDSYAMQLVGLKRKSERRRPTRRSASQG